MTEDPNDVQNAGPLKIPAAPDVAMTRALKKGLHGHTTSTRWLPQGLSPALDELRAEHLRLRRQVSDALDALHVLARRFRKEDDAHTDALRQAHRAGSPTSVEDPRTPAEQRTAERRAIEERLWAGVAVFAEHADHVIKTVRSNEENWLADLRSRLEPAHEKRREAQRLLAEADAEAWTIHRTGTWLQKTSDDGPFGRQPAPTVEAPPANLSPDVLKNSLRRPWHRSRIGAGAPAEGAT